MRYHETTDTLTVFARNIQISGRKLTLDGKLFPYRVGKDVDVEFKHDVLRVFGKASGATLMKVVLDDGQASIDEDFNTIIAGTNGE